jgi:very-short-patch-repair endonuclease
MTNRRINEEIARIAARQHGVVTRQQLLASGLGRGGVHARVSRGLLHPLHAGVYLVGHAARPRLAAEMAAILVCGSTAAISHRTAAVLWTMPVAAPTETEVTIAGRRWPARAGIRVYTTRGWAPGDVRELDGIRVTSPAWTLVDIGKLLRREKLEHVVADSLRRRIVSRTELIRELDRHRGRRGVATLRAVVESGPAMTRSAAERRLLRLIRAASLPSPITNVRVGAHEVDFLWPRERVVVEVDGYQWHSDRAAFERDRLRDAELQALGYRVIRVTWRSLQREPGAVVGRIAAVLRRGSDRAPHR